MTPVREPQLERKGRRLGHSGWRFLLIGILVAIPGVVLVLIGRGWSVGVGLAVLAVAAAVGVVGVGLLVSSLVSRWSARHRLFA